MIMSYLYKIFFKGKNGIFRKAFIFPILSMLIGSYIIFMTISIMDGMEKNIVNRFKRERFAETRKAKLRLSNIKLEEITQVLRGKSKHIKH